MKSPIDGENIQISAQKGLCLHQVTKRYDSIVAVDHVSMLINDREFVAIVGPTGCGKTTLLRLIAGTEKMDFGHIYFQGKCIDDEEPANRRVRMVFQENALWPHMRVYQKDYYSNLSFGMRIRKQMPARIAEAVNIVANRLGIEKKLLPRKPDKLSAGQKQLVGIGRAMTIIPGIFLLDEPLAHIDPQHRLTLRRELKDYHDKMETITLYVSHNLPEAFSLADRVAIMQEGKIIQVDPPARIFSHPANDFVRDFIQCFEI
jgi:multiple sugar transport system ATP-binding protein